jgi:hypothetical protein
MAEKTESDKAADLKAFNFSSYNKLHWMLGGEDYALKTAKDLFVQDLKRAQKYEQDLCRARGGDVVMDFNMFNHVCGLADQCKSFYEVEALARFIFDDNRMPEMPEVREKAAALRKIMPVFDILKATKNARRSF